MMQKLIWLMLSVSGWANAGAKTAALHRDRIGLVPRVFSLFLISFSVSAFSQEKLTQEINLNNAWFKPETIENFDDTVCGYLVDNYTAAFLKGSDNPLNEQFYFNNGVKQKIEWTADETTTRGGVKWAKSQPNAKHKFTIAFYHSYIGWREFSDYAFMQSPLTEFSLSDENYEQAFSNYKIIAISKDDGDSREYKINFENGKYDYTKIILSGRLSSFFEFNNESYLVFDRGTEEPIYILRYAGKDDLELTCKIKIRPATEEIESTTESMPSLKNYRTSLRNMMGSEGSCGGTGHYLENRVRHMEKSFNDLIYQPWVLSGSSDYADLEEWGYSGIWNQQVWKRFLQQKESATKELKGFYASNYSINDDMALKLSQQALDAPVGAFYFLSGSYPETAVNFNYNDGLKIKEFYEITRLIFDGASSSTIKTRLINYDKEIISRGDFLLYGAFRPDITELFLNLGGNPDVANTQAGFGKTPLMYAAQFNQYETAKILIGHGANTNASTTRPLYSCDLLKTFNMTPLHYAVRYASPEFIKLLLDNGASPFIQAENNNLRPMAMETPLDWLNRYTAADSPEKNRNIPDSKIPEIKKWLDVSNKEELSNKVNEYILKAEKDYQAGEIKNSYNKLSTALSIDPDNEKALADMSLVALKNNLLGESVEASSKLIEESVNQKLKDNAAFNYDLACKKFREKNENAYALNYNGESYCIKK